MTEPRFTSALVQHGEYGAKKLMVWNGHEQVCVLILSPDLVVHLQNVSSDFFKGMDMEPPMSKTLEVRHGKFSNLSPDYR